MTVSALTLRQAIARAALRDSTAAALIAPGREALSYGRLLQLVETVAADLASFGLSPGERVALALPASVEAAAAFVTVAANTTCIPFNPEYRVDEWIDHLSCTRARALIVPEKTATPARAAAQNLDIPILEVASAPTGESGWFSLQLANGAKPNHAGFVQQEFNPGPDDIALVLPTSGSTSRPKLVPLTQRNVCLSSQNTGHSLGLSPADRCLNMLPLLHVHGLVSGVVIALMTGGSIAVIERFVPEQVPQWLVELQATWLPAAPAMHRAIVGAIEKDTAALPKTNLRFLRSGSVALSVALIERLEACFGVPVIEAYGMTEVPHISGNPPARRKPGSVGKPIVQEFAIVDEQGNDLGAGHPGEIVVRGPTVTPGYEGEEDTNATAFRNGWFHTGDLGFVDEEGYLFITGRLKEIINRGGQKVSPREIDLVLESHADVRQAVAFGVPHPTLGEDIAAAVVFAEGKRAGESELRALALQNLPPHKVPSRIIAVSDLPKLRTGKVARLKLAELFARELAATPHEVLGADLESQIAGAFGKVLRRTGIGRNDNFFSLGGDSLSGAQAAVRIQRATGLATSLAMLFQAPTPGGLAAVLAGTKSKREATPIVRRARDIQREREP
jgi:acyl-CoA synthetase (AMP-forming)/AMP-acid ligase II